MTTDTYTNHRWQAIRSRTKAAIVWLATRGLMPARLATWMIRRAGLASA